MKSLRNIAILLLVALLAYRLFLHNPGPTSAPKTSTQAPALALTSLAGQPINLASLRETGPVVLLFLRGDVGYQCPICTAQVGEFLAAAGEFAARNATVLLIYPGPTETLAAKAADFRDPKSLPPNVHLLTDPDSKLVSAWNLRWKASGETAYPSTFVVDKDNTITFAKTSDNHGDRATAKEVLAALPPVASTQLIP